MSVDQEPREHDRLVSRLLEAELLEIAAAACQRTGIEGREQQVAYCLIVLATKADTPRRAPDGAVRRPYGLDPDRSDFGDRLASWAATVASNMRTWAEAYEAIHDEADRFEIRTLRDLIRLRAGDDVIDVLADGLAAVVARGPRLDEMSVEHAREREASPAQYAFQSPLPQWIRTAVKRRINPQPDPLDAHDEQRSDGDVRDALDAAADVAEKGERAWIEAIAALAETRSELADLIQRAEAFERELAQRRPTGSDAVAAFRRIRAELVSVADELRRERAALTPMLSYLVLAMRSAPQILHVSVLSLRMEGIDPAAIDAMARTMRTILVDDRHPTPKLIQKTRAAVDHGVSRARAKALEELDAEGRRRAEILAPVAQLLNGLPPVVRDIDDIAAITGSRANIVRQNRHAVGAELGTVDSWFARVFRRYTIGRK